MTGRVIPRVEPQGDGWWPDGQQGSRRIYMRCPMCRRICMLDHEVSAAGLVKPSVGCPWEGKGCSFHESDIVLGGWPP